MKLTLTLFCLFITASCLQASERGPAIPDYQPDPVTDGIHVIHGPTGLPDPANSGFMNNPGIIVTDAGVVIVDPGSSVQSGEMVLRAVSKLTDQPVVAVFNTHVHGDHWLGNQAIREAWPKATIYGHPNMLKQVSEGEGDTWVKLMEELTEGKTRGTHVVGPDQAVDHGDEFSIGGKTFRIHHYGQAHTTGDIMIEVVEDSLVFLGDNVLNGRIPRIVDGDIAGNIRTCDEILRTGARYYVPGHGQTGDRAIVDAMRNYYHTVYSNVERLYEDGMSDFEMKDEISALLKDYAGWEGFDEQLGKHISYSYLKVEAAAF